MDCFNQDQASDCDKLMIVRRIYSKAWNTCGGYDPTRGKLYIKEENRSKTVVNIPVGDYEWNVMNFGLKHAPSKFQKLMDQIFMPYFEWIIVYIDDVLIFSNTIDEHFRHIHTFLKL